MKYLETLKVLDPQELLIVNAKDLPTVKTTIPIQNSVTPEHPQKVRTVLLDNRFSYLRERMAQRKHKQERINLLASKLRHVFNL